MPSPVAETSWTSSPSRLAVERLELEKIRGSHGHDRGHRRGEDRELVREHDAVLAAGQRVRVEAALPLHGHALDQLQRRYRGPVEFRSVSCDVGHIGHGITSAEIHVDVFAKYLLLDLG